MLFKPRLLAAASSLALLGACGGGGTNSTPPPPAAPAPVPAPAPAPTPAPAPAAYQTAAQLSRDAAMVSVGYVATVPDPRGANEFQYDKFAPGYGNQAQFSDNGAKLKLTYGSRTLEFDLTKPVGTPGERRYNLTDTAGATAGQLLITTPSVNGVKLTYLDFADVAALETDSAGRSTGYLVFRAGQLFGSPTRVDDLPTTGTATYSTAVDGIATRDGAGTSYLLRDLSTATFTVNFGNGNIATTLRVIGEGLAGGTGQHDFATLTGNGVLLANSPFFSGNFDSSLYGRFEGGFFGPGATEMGYSWFAQAASWEARGSVAGRKN